MRAGGFDGPTRRLQASIQGTVIAREAPDYELWRQSMIWQYRKFRRYPDLIVQAESEDDVVAAINFARDNGMKITTRSGGHSWSGCFLRDSGVLVDLSRLQNIEVDTSRNVARVGAGVLGRGLNEELARHGLAFPTAHCGMVPVSGYLLGGGLGWNSTAWGGMSVFNVVGIEAVTVEGEKIFASQNKNPDLFWAARGGGPGLFFTVTAFHLQCHPLPASIITDSYFFHYAELDEVVALMEEVGPGINPNVEMLTVVVPTIPELAKQCEGSECDRVVVLAATAFGESEADSKAMLAPIASHRAASKSLKVIKARPTPFEVLYQDNEGPFPQRRARADNIYTNRASDTVPVISKYMKQSPSDGNTPVILWRGDLSFPDAAYSSTGQFYLAGYAQWNLAENDQPNQQWLRNFYDEMQEFASGHYINEFDRETRSAQTSACFAPANWAKLGRLRERYDPDGVYHDFLRL
ncbi:FAD-binding oxidoreductase [Kineobactrum salinum]|uniref:FAD-binding oxidoreductase n=1 Tax=Kineobactrum salinum TaxID=2708301 RepID=UPI001E328B48|nr:FAD-binding oxidoreductase [Kineobactrum salinum]